MTQKGKSMSLVMIFRMFHDINGVNDKRQTETGTNEEKHAESIKEILGTQHFMYTLKLGQTFFSTTSLHFLFFQFMLFLFLQGIFERRSLILVN